VPVLLKNSVLLQIESISKVASFNCLIL